MFDNKVLSNLIAQAKALGPFVMPIDEIRLASQVADLAGDAKFTQEKVVATVRNELWNDENFHARRVAVNSIRRIGEFNIPGLAEDLVAKLDDSEPWVQYDAAWAIELADLRTPDAIAGLKKLSEGMRVPSPADKRKLLAGKLGDAKLQARLRAAEALKKLGVEE